MPDQYYTPALEDLHYGYECEIFDSNKQCWIPVKLDVVDILKEAFTGIAYDPEWIRTPYLTRDAIEGEGWTHVPKNEGKENVGNMQRFDLDGKFLIYYDLHRHLLSTMGATALKCPSINELRKIMKMVGVEKKEPVSLKYGR